MADRDDMCRRIFSLADTDNDGFIWRRDLETVCSSLDLGYTADSVLPNDHRGRVTLKEFQRYFARLPPSLIWPPGRTERNTGLEPSPSWRGGSEKPPTSDALGDNKIPAAGSPQLTNLRSEIMDLNNRLNQVTQERDSLQQALKIIEGGHNKSQGDDQRWEMQCQRYEERIIELHSVIAELSKKMSDEEDGVIKEESEYESNVDNQSIATDSFVDEKLRYEDEYEDYTSLAFERDLEIHTQSLKKSKQPKKDNCVADSGSIESAVGTSDTKSDEATSEYHRQLEMQVLEMYGLKDELNRMAVEKKELLDQLDKQQSELANARTLINGITVERDNYKRQISDLKTTVEYQEAKMESGNKTPVKELPLLSRFAERRSLRKKRSDKNRAKDTESPVGGSELPGYKAGSMTPDSMSPSPQTEFPHPLANVAANHPLANVAAHADKLKQYDLETDRLRCQLDHLKSQNDVLTLTLDESKTSCDRLVELMGRYESNNTALQLALSTCDHMIESYDVLVALLETNALIHSDTNSLEKKEFSGHQRAQSYRKSAESVAKHLLSRLDKTSRPDSGLATSHLDTTWEDSSGYSHTTSSTSTTSSGLEPDFSQNDENRLRDLISRLKMARSSIQATVMELESVYQDHAPSLEGGSNSVCNSTADLEVAVLAQEMMAMREDRADLRAKVYLLEKEKQGLELGLVEKGDKETLLRTKMEHLQEELLYREASQGKHKGIHLDEREVYLRERVENLLDTLEKLTKNSEVRQKQSGDLIEDLKKANGALTDALEKSKKKYQMKIKKLEQQLLSLMSQKKAANPVQTTSNF